jgi:hypothetical protein
MTGLLIGLVLLIYCNFFWYYSVKSSPTSTFVFFWIVYGVNDVISCVNGYYSINDLSPNTSITFLYYEILVIGCSIIIVSPFYSSSLNFVYSPFTPLPDVRIKPDPFEGSNFVILSFSLNRYLNIYYIYGYSCFFLVMGFAYLPSLNLSFPILIVFISFNL